MCDVTAWSRVLLLQSHMVCWKKRHKVCNILLDTDYKYKQNL